MTFNDTEEESDSMAAGRRDGIIGAVMLIIAVGALVPPSACDQRERPVLPECPEKTSRAFNVCFQSPYNDVKTHFDSFRDAVEMTVVSNASNGLNQKCHESCGEHQGASTPRYSFLTLRDSQGREWGVGIYPDDPIPRLQTGEKVLLYWLVDDDLPGPTCGISLERPSREIVIKYVRDAGWGGSTAASDVGSPGPVQLGEEACEGSSMTEYNLEISITDERFDIAPGENIIAGSVYLWNGAAERTEGASCLDCSSTLRVEYLLINVSGADMQ